jgi:hypothetical protein
MGKTYIADSKQAIRDKVVARINSTFPWPVVPEEPEDLEYETVPEAPTDGELTPEERDSINEEIIAIQERNDAAEAYYKELWSIRLAAQEEYKVAAAKFQDLVQASEKQEYEQAVAEAKRCGCETVTWGLTPRLRELYAEQDLPAVHDMPSKEALPEPPNIYLMVQDIVSRLATISGAMQILKDGQEAAASERIAMDARIAKLENIK